MADSIFPIAKELFIETIEALKKQSEHDSACSKALILLTGSSDSAILEYDNSWLSKQLIKLIQILTNDYCIESWIKYFIYELNFGKSWHVGCVTSREGNDIRLSDAEDLYNLLVSEYDLQFGGKMLHEDNT